MYYQKLEIDELWAGSSCATNAHPGVTYEAENGFLQGGARKAPCETCSDGRKVEHLGKVSLPVWSPEGGDQVLTAVGTVNGTATLSIEVDGRPSGKVVMTGWSTPAPLPGRSLTVRLHKG
jgi:hypothetical protein